MSSTYTYDGKEPVRLNKWMASLGICSRREAEALPTEGWYDEQIQLGEDRSEVAILVAAMELDGESINDRRSELVQIVGLFVERRCLAVCVKLELTSPEPVESFDEDVHPLAG